jgi:hypothetical protein
VANVTELWIKVPNPFFGVDTVGFSVRYDAESDARSEVPFFVEGEAARMRGLADRLQMLARRERFVDCSMVGEAYRWSDPIPLTDEVIFMAFQDHSLEAGDDDPVRTMRNRLRNQLVPLAFPFLRDLVRVAGMRLSPMISFLITASQVPDLELELPVDKIVRENGTQLLSDL